MARSGMLPCSRPSLIWGCRLCLCDYLSSDVCFAKRFDVGCNFWDWEGRTKKVTPKIVPFSASILGVVTNKMDPPQIQFCTPCLQGGEAALCVVTGLDPEDPVCLHCFMLTYPPVSHCSRATSRGRRVWRVRGCAVWCLSVCPRAMS